MAIQSRLPAFLLTRPSAQSARFADMLRDRFGDGLTVVISPLMQPEFPVPKVPSGPFAALVFTSETGVAAYRRDPARFAVTGNTAYCVGGRTAQAAQAAGLAPVSAEGDADALVALILSQRPSGPLLHLCGADTRGDVAGRLTAGGILTTACTAYRQADQPLTDQAKTLLRGERPVVVPLFSPRSARLFLAQIGPITPRAPLVCAVLSAAVAEPLLSQPIKLLYAKEPNAMALLDSLVGAYDATQTP